MNQKLMTVKVLFATIKVFVWMGGTVSLAIVETGSAGNFVRRKFKIAGIWFVNTEAFVAWE